jgi:hypothetical protein
MAKGYRVKSTESLYYRSQNEYVGLEKTIDNFGPVILIEVKPMFGGILLFSWWQLRNLKKEREQGQKKKAQNTELDWQEGK